MRHAQGRAGECHIVARTAEQDEVRELQRTLYRAAKAEPGRRFHALYVRGAVVVGLPLAGRPLQTLI
jgi:hypothetical protein